LNWQNIFRNLHREWQRSINTLSRSKSDFARRKLLESAIIATKKNITSLKKQLIKERKSLINELGKIRRSILIWGKAIFGTGVSHELTLSQVKEQINQQSGIISIKDVNGVHIRNLSIVKNNKLIKDQIQSETKGHYRTASLYPEEVSIIDENDDEWVFLFQKIEVYPFAQKNGKLKKNINKKIRIKGGSLIKLDQIQFFLAKEKIKNEALKDWLKEELININEENSEIEHEIHLTIKNYKKRENEINQDLQELQRRLMELNKELKILPNQDNLKQMNKNFLKIKSQYKKHHSQRTVIDFRKIYDSPTSGQRLKDVFTTMVLEAWNSYNVNVGDYTEEILVESGKLESYTERQLHWKPIKSAFQILYLTRRKAGSQTQYIVNIGIYIHLINKDLNSDHNKVNNNNDNNDLKEIDYNKKGISYLEEGNTEKAIESLKKAIELKPEDHTAYINLAELMMIIDPNKSIKILNEAIKINPNSFELKFSRGKAYYEVKLYEEAINDLTYTIDSIEADMEDAYFIYKSKSIPPGLKDNFELILPWAYSIRGKCLEELTRESEAISDLKRTIDLTKDISLLESSYSTLGRIFEKNANYKEAIYNYNKLINLNPTNENIYYAYYRRGLCHLYLDNYNIAINDANKAAEINPKFDEIYLLKAVCYDKIGNEKLYYENVIKAAKLGSELAQKVLKKNDMKW